jgi:hypothetical protein
VTNRRFAGAVAAALALAACSDNRSADSPLAASDPESPSGLPILASAKVVTPAAQPAPGQFSITLRFINPPTATQASRFTAARTKWEGIISGDVPDVTGHIPARSCGNSFKTPVFDGTIDDILIDVLLQPIDGPGPSWAPRSRA